MSANNTNVHNNQYEEPLPPDHQWLGEKWRDGNRPLRIRKNPLEVAPCRKGECASANQLMEFRQWVAREWAVYAAEVDLLRKDVEQCWYKHGVDVIRHCEDKVKKYLHAVDEKTIREVRAKLMEGKRAVE
ncbi:hypothetical protein FDP41_009891 [Naegleria fowleri]|uniref:Uncharacterized protein n=1 Tax=Naegleria fowleri TaxID=5763 RepID=A0A6A5BCD7_NAEFO|nr:uncharacterized protein FDP41_009891 [Naegleria fowleri]KAF0971668.1 hypothetical protein FDP41_009891 [Naegleria fowleri]CAG4711160.1 unnamed protein product [Naegleria fowleri]